MAKKQLFLFLPDKLCDTAGKLLLCLLFICFASSKAAAVSLDSLRKKIPHFELSFGQSLLFISNSDLINLRNTKNVVLPTSAMLFFAEFRSDKKIRIPIFFNLPTEAKPFLVNGQLILEKASPTLGSGLEFRLFQIKIDSKSKIEGEAGPLVTMILDGQKSQAVPLLAGRIKIMRGENFIMYIGGSYTFGVNTLGMFYGTGSVF
jgi:hypothetical protein